MCLPRACCGAIVTPAAQQEAFSAYTRHALIAALADAGCKYHVHFVSGIGLPSQFEGSGLLLISRHKIVDVDYRRFVRVPSFFSHRDDVLVCVHV